MGICEGQRKKKVKLRHAFLNNINCVIFTWVEITWVEIGHLEWSDLAFKFVSKGNNSHFRIKEYFRAALKLTAAPYMWPFLTEMAFFCLFEPSMS